MHPFVTVLSSCRTIYHYRESFAAQSHSSSSLVGGILVRRRKLADPAPWDAQKRNNQYCLIRCFRSPALLILVHTLRRLHHLRRHRQFVKLMVPRFVSSSASPHLASICVLSGLVETESTVPTSQVIIRLDAAVRIAKVVTASILP